MKLNYGFHFKKGRSRGKISSFHRGGGRKRLYRAVDFSRNINGIKGKIVDIIKDPNRGGYLFLTALTNGIFFYILGVSRMKKGDFLHFETEKGKDNISREGTICRLLSIKPGERISNLEQSPGRGGLYMRGAGTFGIFLKKYNDYGLVKLPSGEYKLFSLNCIATIGRVCNEEKKEERVGKAGTSRKRGKRPIVRGIAMNPVDHPHGGRTNGGVVPSTPWGRIAKGVKTKKNKRKNKLITRSLGR